MASKGLRFLQCSLLAALGCGFLLAGTAQAADAEDQVPSFHSTVPIWKHSLKWWMQHTYWRLGGSETMYFGSSNNVLLVDTPDCRGTASLALACGQPLQDTGAGVSSHDHFASMTLGIVMPFGGGHFSNEILLAAPLKLKFETRGRLINQSIAGTALNLQPGDPLLTGAQPVGRTVGYIHALPPNFTIVYKPWLHSIIQPYVGIGMYWLYSYSFNVTSPALNDPKHGIQQPELTLSRPIGCIGQAGFDVKLPWGMYFRANARYLGCATVHATLAHVEQYAPRLTSVGDGIVDAGTLRVNDKMRMMIFSLTLGSSFWGD
ncbi:MAG TPA: OmpW family outer membrane protein [Nevskiaceae bacterium]|nr:OmpW family outer membrane protein [Nevskiaceae bacterium]